MAATTTRSEPPAAPVEPPRFSGGERALHWINSALFLFLLATAAALYAGPISALVGRRDLVRWLHVIAGLALPVPLLVAALRSAPFRADLRRLNRFTSDDWRWFRRRRPLGEPKFNAGQKLNAAFIAGSIPVMLATGAVMKWFDPFPLRWRTGATFVHDVVAIMLLIVIVGHIVKALADPPKLRAMWSGSEDAKRTHVR